MTGSQFEDMDRELQRILLEEVDPWTAFNASPWSGNPDARRRMEEFMGLTETLDAFGAEQRTELRELADRSDPGRGLEEVRRVLGSELDAAGNGSSGERERSAPAKLPRRQWLAAAGAVLAAGVLWRLGNEQGPTGPGGTSDPVMGVEFKGATPQGEQQSFAEFRWPKVPRAQFYRVVVRDAAGKELGRSPLLDVTNWSPEDPSAWPDEIEWHVLVRTTRSEVTLPDGGEWVSARR